MRLSLSLFLFAPFALAAQTPKVITLKPANAVLAHEFSAIVSVRGLSDGRVLVSDQNENRILIGNFTLNTVAQVGHDGQGPGEYEHASRLTALGGDTTAVPANSVLPRRWLQIAGSRISETPPQGMPVDSQSIPAWGADTRGYLLGVRDPASDSGYLVRIARSTGRVSDTITRLFKTPARQPSGGELPYNPTEFGLLAIDGWIAVPRLDPYRIDWRSSQGKWTHGPVIPGGNPPLDSTEKAAIIARRNVGAAVTVWPATIPAFNTAYRHFLTPDGKLLLFRTTTAAHPWLYDLINRRGEREGQLEMSSSRLIAGFGEGSIYIAVRNKDGIEKLERHPWP